MIRNCSRLNGICFLLVSGILLSAFSADAFAQTTCLSEEDIKKMLVQLGTQPENVSLNTDLQTELAKMRAETDLFIQRIQTSPAENKKLNEEAAATKVKNVTRLCQILQQNGWLTRELVGTEGITATVYLIKNIFPVETQARLLPVINAAINKNEIEKNADLAGLIDRLYLHSGMKQIFGTQAYVSEGFLILAPLQSEGKVDEWRKSYNLPPLKAYIRTLQNSFQKPLIRLPGLPARETAAKVEKADEKIPAEILENAPRDGEIIRVDTELVNLNVSVFGKDSKTFTGALEQSDFKIYEDGREQTVSFFARTEMPSDLVLVLDLSGSTADKIGLIRKSTRKFIETKRPMDRIAIVTFSNDAQIVSPLREDGSKLLESTGNIKGRGSSHVWDALKFTLENVFDDKSANRRRAVVFMTDGADNALMFYPGVGSKMLFSDLLEIVRSGNTIIVPIYLDTEGNTEFDKRMYLDARNTLSLLAKESGGTFYKARKLEDLNGVYEQVQNDLSKIYNLGYAPENEKRDGEWRTITVAIPNRPDLIVKTKTGYYAK